MKEGEILKHGIYYAYWASEWEADYRYYIEKAARLGFDILEIGAAKIPSYSLTDMQEIRRCAADHGIELTAGYGPSADRNLSSSDPAVQKNAVAFFTDLLKRLEIMDIHVLAGGIYSYWPVDFSRPFDKARDWACGVQNVRTVGKVAGDCGVAYCLEVLNRFEGYLLNVASEGLAFVREVDVPAVLLHLDTFHMNIEEDDMCAAIRSARGYLGHFHTGENNRRVPGKGSLPWQEIGRALRDIGYDGRIVMEPFVRMGGQVGSDIKIWHDASHGATEAQLDADAVDALAFSRRAFDRA